MSGPDQDLDMPEGEEPMPRGTRVMAIVRWGLLGAMAVLAVFAWTSLARSDAGKAEQTAAAKKVRYRCPMHPQIVSDDPGECPICHMTLEPFTPAPPPPADAGTRPPGTVPIQLSFDRVQATGVRTSVATSREMKRIARVTAVVEPSEQGASEVHVRTAGFVESIAVNQTGIQVGAGQALFFFYSPAIFEAEQEFVATKQWAATGDATSNAARTKLGLLGVPPGEIAAIERTGVAQHTVAVVAPRSGYVVKKGVVAGSYVTPEMALYTVQDLSRVFVVASVFPGDRDIAVVGAQGTFRLGRAPDEATTGRVDLVYPSVDADARTTRVRMQFDNPRRRFLPGDYGVVEFAAEPRTMTMVPRDAIVNTGTQTYAFIDEGAGRFSPRSVVLGEQDGDQIAVETGIRPGERVVSGATFLIDSESRLQASISAQAAGPAAASPCDADFDKAKYPDKWAECRKCEQMHAGMGSMVTDCKNAIPKPWR